MTSSEVYEDIKDKLKDILNDLKLAIKQNCLDRLNGEDRQRYERDIERASSQAHTLIKDLEYEIHQAPVSHQAQMNREIRQLKLELEHIERNIEKKQPKYLKQATFGRGSSSSSQLQGISGQTTSTLLLGHKSLQRASASIAHSKAVAAESEDIGNDILDNLGQQRDQLLHTRDRLEDTENQLTKSRQILHAINKNIIKNRAFLVFIIFIELALLGVVTYLKFFHA